MFIFTVGFISFLCLVMMMSLETGGKYRLPAKAREICVRHLLLAASQQCFLDSFICIIRLSFND